MARILGIEGEERRAVGGWELALVPPGAAKTPRDLAALPLRWLAARVPGTCAEVLQALGEDPARADREDVWYRCRIERADALYFGGLATLAEVFLDGELVLRSRNMFHAHEVPLARGGDLHVRFASVASALRERQPRGRWKVNLVREQHLRHLRTSLLGRAPGFGPPHPAVGPFREVELVSRGEVRVAAADVRATLDGDTGRVAARLRVEGARGGVLRVGSAEERLVPAGDGTFTATVSLPGAPRWWPHTHGEPALHEVSAVLDGKRVDLGRTGFRTLELDREGGDFLLRVNGERVFCAGAVHWPGLLTPHADARATLLAARGASMNMIRSSALGLYEDDRFFAHCDELGLLVWQDFMFTSFDYPADEAFRASVAAEARQLAARTQLSPSVAVFCGSSEVPQRVAMLGLDPALANNALFDEVIPGECAALRPDVPYVRASAESARVDRGASHYYAVGAYRKPVESARTDGVRFASECLAFSHIPSDAALGLFLTPGETPPTAPSWKAAVPRDSGSGWDHEDVRDHYLRTLFAVDPVELRWTDPGRWLELSRVVPGEVMLRVLGQLRRAGGACNGALLLALRDAHPSCGFGLLDHAGSPKASYWPVRRALAGLALFAIDEGVNGLSLHAVNSTRAGHALVLSATLFRGDVSVGSGERALRLAPGSAAATSLDDVLGRFVDSAWAHRFGPAGYDVAWATLRDQQGAVVAEAFHFPGALPSAVHADVGLSCTAARGEAGSVALSLRSRSFAQ